MAPLDDLPADQRAAVQLLLKQGQTYEQLADLLGIDPGGVRTRAHAALDALGPEPGPGLDAAARADVADYLLGQQSVTEREATRERLAESPDAGEWAREVAGELRPLAGDNLPDVPAGVAGAAAVEAPPETEVYEPEPEPEPEREREPEPEPVTEDEPAVREETPARERLEDQEPARFLDEEEVAQDEPAAFDFPPRAGREPREPRRRGAGPTVPRAPSSRLGGALLLGGVGIVIAVVLVLLLNGGGDDNGKSTSVTRTAPTQTSTNAQTPIAQINLVSASGNSKQVGLAQVFEQSGRRALIVAGQGLKSGAYALWLYNSRKDAKLLGFVPQRVGADGRFATQGELPSDAKKYAELVVTKEKVTSRTKNPPKKPGDIVLRGALKLP